MPICIQGELREIRIIFPCVSEDISNGLIKNYYSYPDQSFLKDMKNLSLCLKMRLILKLGIEYLSISGSQTLEFSGNKQSYQNSRRTYR